MVNLHFSLLPRWRGAAPVERALLAGDDETGVCLMQLEEGLDTGPASTPRSRCRSAPTTTADELRDELVEVGTAAAGRHARRRARSRRRRRRASRRTRPRSTRRARASTGRRPAGRARPPRAPRRRVDDVPRQAAEGAGREPAELDGRRPGARRRRSASAGALSSYGAAGGQAARWRSRRGATAPGRRAGRLVRSRSTTPAQLAYRRAAAHRPRRRLRQPRRCPRARPRSVGSTPRDRAFVTELVYGTTRMRRACERWSTASSSTRPPTRRCARCCAWAPTSSRFAGVPPHAAVGETVGARAEAHARLRQRRPAPGRDTPMVVARRCGPAELPGLDRRRGSSPSSARPMRSPRWSA